MREGDRQAAVGVHYMRGGSFDVIRKGGGHGKLREIGKRQVGRDKESARLN
ncbi:hypothetical protein [Polaromonas sp. CG9_12]|nr:hypothetical protein [Polaromonas sp. CG9_12]